MPEHVDDAVSAEQEKAATLPEPDQGRAAWLAVLGGWCCCFTSYGWLSSIGVFQTYYEQHLLSTYSSSSIAWILSVQVFTLTGLAPINGKIFDSYGSTALLLAGTFFHIFGLMMLSLSTQYYQIFLSQSLCSGLGSACLYHGSINAVQTWFVKKRGMALGIVASGSSIGSVVVPILFNQTVGTIGFGWSIRAIAFLYLGLQLIAILTVRSRLHHRPSRLVLMAFVRPYLHDRVFLFNALGAFFTFWGILIPFNYIPLAAQASGMSPALAAYLIPIINGASLLGRLVPPWAGDSLGRFNAALLANLLGVVLIFAVWIPAQAPSNAPTIVFAVLWGLPLGCFAAILPALIGQISDVREIGVRYGATFFLTAWAGLTGNPIAGALITRGAQDLGDDGAQFNYLKVFCGLTIAIGAGFLALARHAQPGVGRIKKV